MWLLLSILSHALSGAEGEVEGRRIEFAQVLDPDGEVRHKNWTRMNADLDLPSDAIWA